MRGRILTAAILASLLGLVMTGCAGPAEGATVGNRAPDFQLQDLNGQTVSLSEQRGLPVIINFWGIWCGWCVYEMPHLQEIHDEYYRRGLTLLAVNVGEDSTEITEFMADNNLTLKVLLDTRGSVAQQYAITSYPTTFFIDKDGIIQDKVAGAFFSAAQIEYYLEEIMP